MVLSFSAKNNLCCWTFPSVWWCHDVYLLFPMRAVGRPRGSQCTWLWYDCAINIRSKNMFFSNYVPSLFLGLLTCPNPCLVGPCTQSRRYWWRLPSPLLPGWYYISLTTFHQVWNIFLVVLSRDLELFEITSMMWILPICLLSLNTEFCNTTRTLGKLEPIWDHFRTLIPIGPYW